MTSDDVTLRVNGKIHAGWTSVQITRSLETVSGGFSLSVTEQWPGHQDLFQITPGAACKVSIGSDVLITGWVDDTGPSYDANSHEFTVRGRDVTGDLVDCSALAGAGRWNHANLLTIVGDLCKPFGIGVKSTVADVMKTIWDHHIQLGETAFECIERVCRIYAVLPTSDGAGNLVLTRAGEGGAIAELKLGGNIKAGSGSFSDRERFSRYIVIGQSIGSEATDPSLFTAYHAESLDSAITRYRPLIVLAEASGGDPDWYQRRADWERASRAGKSKRATITVNGWRDANDALYRPNTMVRIDDDFLGLHGSMLIAGATLSLTDQGQLTELTLVRKEAFLLEPPSALTFDAPGGAS